MPLLEGPWSWFKDTWLVSRQAVRLFFVAVVFVLALIPVFLGLVDPAKMSLAMRLPWTIVGMVGTISLFFLWFGMWRYWMRLDHSRVFAKRLWFVVLLFGLWYGSCLYYFFVYRPQVTRRQGTETKDGDKAWTREGMFKRILIVAFVVFLGGALLLDTTHPTLSPWAAFALVLASTAYLAYRRYREERMRPPEQNGEKAWKREGVYRRMLIAGWALFAASLLAVVVAHPKPGAWRLLARGRPVLFFLLVLGSLAYPITRVYHEGMKRARRR